MQRKQDLHESFPILHAVRIPLIKYFSYSFAADLNYIEWTCSRGFLQRFCHRYAVLSKRICGEGNDCADTTTFTEEVLIPLLSQFDPEDIYNADESSLFFKLLPGRTYAFRGEQVIGGRSSKDRVTLMLCSNMDGSDKLRPVIIGKVKNPRVLKTLYGMSTADLPVDYYSSANGWMTGFIFDKWLSKWNAKLAAKKRNVLLLLDNAPSHVVQTYSNIRIQFLPPNTTSKLQPMDQGMLRLVKVGYRASISDMYLDGIQNNEEAKVVMKKINIKVVCDLVVSAWASVKATTIQNCFSKAGILHHVPLPLQTSGPSTEVWDRVQVALDVDVEFEAYATADDTVESSQHLSEEEIIQAVLNDCKEHQDNPDQEAESGNDDDDDDISETAVKSYQDCLESLVHIRAYFQRNKMDTDVVERLEKQLLDHKLANSSRQSLILSFLK